MRCYKVKVVTERGLLAARYAGTQADARETKRRLTQELGVKKDHVTIDQDEIPYAKDELLVFVNNLLKKLDKPAV